MAVRAVAACRFTWSEIVIRERMGVALKIRETRVRYGRGFSIAGAFGQSEISRLAENALTRSLGIRRTHAQTAPFNAW